MGANTIYGVQVLFQNAALYDAANGDRIAAQRAHIDAAAELGVDVIRFPGDWRMLQPESGATYAQWYVDEVLATLAHAKSLGVSVVMTFAQTPFWATDGSGDPNSQAAIWAPPTGAAADAYANALVLLHDKIEAAGLLDTVNGWEIWNEPNTTTFWPTADLRAGTDVQVAVAHAAEYVALLNTAYDALKATDPSARVLGGALAACDVDYLEAMYAAGAKFDALALHPYTKANPFNGGYAYAPDETSAGDALSQVWSFEYGVNAMRDVLVAHGDAAKGMWFTEFGWSSTNAWGGAGSAEAQAAFLSEALQIIDGWDFVDGAIAYRLFDGQGEEFGMRLADGTLKASGLALKAFLDNHAAPGPVLLGTASADTLLGDANNNIIDGFAGNDHIDGGAGNDVVRGGAGDNNLFGGDGNDILSGGCDSDATSSSNAIRVIIGDAATGAVHTVSQDTGATETTVSSGIRYSSTASGDTAGHWIVGLGGSYATRDLGGNDRIDGGAGDDIVRGGLGADTLSGGAGRDQFDFRSSIELGSTASTRDVILDFVRGDDTINLANLDANALAAGDQAFAWIGTSAFHGVAGELHGVAIAGGLVIEGDHNGDGRADFQIELRSISALSAADFIL